MQDTLNHNKYTNPSAKALELIYGAKYSDISLRDKLKKQIIDEEMTHAAEIIASVSGEADIPRIYYEKDNDFVDPHGVSLRSVLKKGIEYLEDPNNKKIGWQWEIERRKIELKNLENILTTPDGFACIEISSTDLSKPEREQLEHGYNGDTLLRINLKNNGRLIQRNVLLKTSDLKILNKLRKVINPGTSEVVSSDKMLSKMIYVSLNEVNLDNFIAQIKNFVSEELYSQRPHELITKIIRSSIQQNKNAWDIVKENCELFNDMYSRFEDLAFRGVADAKEINLVRAGVWQSLLDSVSDKKINSALNIDDGLRMARALGAVFTSCGGTIDMSSIGSGAAYTYTNRFSIAKTLIDRVGSLGVCSACGSPGLLYGCGVYCRSCNDIWCNAYLFSGEHLTDKEVSEKQYRTKFKPTR